MNRLSQWSAAPLRKAVKGMDPQTAEKGGRYQSNQTIVWCPDQQVGEMKTEPDLSVTPDFCNISVIYGTVTEMD